MLLKVLKGKTEKESGEQIWSSSLYLQCGH